MRGARPDAWEILAKTAGPIMDFVPPVSDMAPVAAYLNPGQIIATAEPTRITTILGSCVGVCLWDSRSRVGGMNHYLLPTGASGESSLRFGRVAIPSLIEQVLALGCRVDDLRAKVVGGACVLDVLQNEGKHLGDQNVELAMELMNQAGIPVVGVHAGGHRGRKVIFQTFDGVAMVKRL